MIEAADVRPVPADSPVSALGRRIVAGVVALACAGVLGMAAIMTPSEAGLGTHRQLRLPECGWITMMDMPCPTCGMTTAFAHAADGRLLASARTQPLGALLAVATAMTLLASTYVAATGSRLARRLGRLVTTHSMWAVATLAVAAWAYKILSYKGVL